MGEMMSACELAKKYSVGELQKALLAKLPSFYKEQLYDSNLRAKKDSLALLGGEENEKFLVYYLNSRNYLIDCVVEFNGSISCNVIFARPIVQRAFKLNAAHVIFAHNHPSGFSAPSTSDIRRTRELIETLRPLNIDVLDHIIVGDDACSLRESHPEIFTEMKEAQ